MAHCLCNRIIPHYKRFRRKYIRLKLTNFLRVPNPLKKRIGIACTFNFKNNIVQKYLITKIEQSNLKVNKQRN